ncbi:LysR substrate-binding domain-containing protein [Burkholderia plantarii]|uniref:LysR substrate-binding domain-containing protein n=1 Tax=Burkholderia plantarii TaxID=41899 RepID=UPI0018DCE19B|nr:LysR substrate-binding domain-containing protein [Burkholderia plantarii]MBI0325678.1 LysR family transcriptional regulator [Burkholderia plantarii]
MKFIRDDDENHGLSIDASAGPWVAAGARFTLRQLRYFVAAVTHGGAAQASRRLFIAQPSIASAIRGLEEHFGVQLCIRHHAQGITLTPAGERFHRDAVALLRSVHAFEQSALAGHELAGGEISVGCYEPMAPWLLPRLIAGFRARHPGVRFRIGDGEQPELVDGLRRGRYDLAIVYDQALGDDLDRTPLRASARPHVLLAAGHPLAACTTLSLAQLCDAPMILLDVEPSRRYFLGLFEAAGLAPSVAFASPSIEMVRGLVGHGAGFALLVTRPAADLTYDGMPVVARPLAGRLATTMIVAATLSGAQPTPLTRAFVDHCVAALAEGGDDGRGEAGGEALTGPRAA